MSSCGVLPSSATPVQRVTVPGFSGNQGLSTCETKFAGSILGAWAPCAGASCDGSSPPLGCGVVTAVVLVFAGDEPQAPIAAAAATVAARERTGLNPVCIPSLLRVDVTGPVLRRVNETAVKSRASAGDLSPSFHLPPAKGWGHMRVLIVEDQEKLATLIQKGLRKEGMAPDVARSGEDALWMAAATPYDAIILDVMLPGTAGFDVCRRLRGDGVGSPILMLTARDAIRDRVAGLDAGADDYLVK